MFRLTPLILLASTFLVACGSGSSDPVVNPHGDCAQAIADYEENNNVTPEDPGQLSDYAIGDGNYRTFYVGVTGGVAQTAFFYWGADYDGCQASYQ